MEKLKVLSLFSGIGAYEKALARLGIDFEIVNFCEIDRFAVKSYCAIHGESENKNLGDITTVDYSGIGKIDLICGGSPCQDFSVAGQQKGVTWICKTCGETFNPLQQHYLNRSECLFCGSENLDKTRSSLIIEFLRSVREKKPNYIIYENVKNVVGKKFKQSFKIFENELKDYGYDLYWKIINAKDMGVPQNRERIFVVGIRKDVNNENFEFPEKFDSGLRLRELLESEVSEKFYLSADKTNKLMESLKEREYSNTVRSGGRGSTDRHTWDLVAEKVGNSNPSGRGMNGNVYDAHCLSPAITTNKGEGSKILIKSNSLIQNGGDQQPKILEPFGCRSVGRNPNKPTSRIVGLHTEQRLEINTKGISNCLTSVAKDSYVIEPGNIPEYRIRKLTPKECLRLMDFSDEDYDKIKSAGISDSQIYRQSQF